MMEIKNDIQYRIDLLFSRCPRAAGIVYFDDPHNDPGGSRISLWSGTTGVNTYTTTGIEVDHWNFSKKPKNRKEAETLIREHYESK